MNWNKVINEKLFKINILDKFDWNDTFIRETSIISPSYIRPDKSVVSPDALPSIRIFFSSQSEDYPGLELLFTNVQFFSVSFMTDLEPDICILDRSVKWKFHGLSSDNDLIISESLYYRLLDINTWGTDLRYSWESIFNIGGELVIL